MDLQWAADHWFKPKTSPKEDSTKAKSASQPSKPPLDPRELPALIESNSDDSDSESEDSAGLPGGKPNPTPRSPKRQKMRSENGGVTKKVEPTGIRKPAPVPAKKSEGQTFKPGFLVHSNNDTVKKIVPEKKTAPPPQPQRPVEPRPQPEVAPPAQKEAERDVFMRVASEGSSCYKESIFQGAKDKYGECLALIDSSYKALNFSQPVKKSSEVVVIKFMYARACTGQHTYKVNRNKVDA